jgi:hypothetical protein
VTGFEEIKKDSTTTPNYFDLRIDSNVILEPSSLYETFVGYINIEDLNISVYVEGIPQ